MTKNRYVSLVITVGAATTALSLLMMSATTPLGVGPTGVTLWFLALLTALSSWFALAAYYIAQRLPIKVNSDQLMLASWRRGVFLGGYVTILLALSSLRQLNLRDALLMMLLLILVEFYLVAKA